MSEPEEDEEAGGVTWPGDVAMWLSLAAIVWALAYCTVQVR